MLEAIVTSAVVSKGYNGAAALRYSEKGDSVRFRIGKKIYDSRAENNTRWFNISVKAFGDVCERIRKMQLKEGSFVNFRGRLDEDSWTDAESGEAKSAIVIILQDIEYAGGGTPKENQAADQQGGVSAEKPPHDRTPQKEGHQEGEMPGGFTGYESFGSSTFFD